MNVIFDLDGVILDSERIYVASWMEAAKKMGVRLDYEKCLSLRSMEHDLGQKIFHEWFGDEANIEVVRAKRNQIMFGRPFPVKEGVREFVAFLRDNDIPYAICTSSPKERGEKKLRQAGIGDLFPLVISARACQRGKPYPDPYILTCEDCGFLPDETYCIEDSPNGFYSAFASGCHTIFDVDLSEPTEDIATKADFVIHSLLEAIPFLKRKKK